MAYIGNIGERITRDAEVKGIYSFESIYGTMYIVNMVDPEGNALVWKTSAWTDAERGDKVSVKGTVKDHSEYKGTEQTVLSRCKIEILVSGRQQREAAKAARKAAKEAKASEQRGSLKGKDFIWTMPYKQFKEHYSDCETVEGSFERTPYGCTIEVIIREGRLKGSGVRGQHFYGFEMHWTDREGKETWTTVRAVCEENAESRIQKDFPEAKDIRCEHIW